MDRISKNELVVLDALDTLGEVLAECVATAAQFTPGHTSTYLKRLVAKGYARRVPITEAMKPTRG